MSYFGTQKLARIPFGDTEIAKAYLGDTLVFQKGGGPTPPPVTLIPYIRNTSDTAYIDTGITPDNNTRVIVWARNWHPGGNNFTFLFGSRVAANNAMYAVCLLNNENTGRLYLGFGNSGANYDNKWRYFAWYHKYELRGKDFYVDDVLVASRSASTFSNNLNIYLFGLNNGGTFAGCNRPIDICAAQIYKNDVLVRDFKAVNSPSVGLYDSVSGTLFTNAGSGSFTYGTFNMDGYTPLEYLECNGASYFDSGVYGGYTVPVVSKFNASARDSGAIVGYRGSSDWMEFEVSPYSSNGVHFYYRLASDSTWRYMYRNATATNLTGNDIVLVKGLTNAASIYKNYSRLGSQVSPTSSASYVTSDTLSVAGLKLPDHYGEIFKGKLYYVSIGTQHAFVPAKDSSDVPGMYDTYNDVFYPSESGTPFVAGPTI